MQYKEALANIGGLSKTSKMPGFSWSISALVCPTGSKLRGVKGSTCENCYAMKGMYRFPNVKQSHERKLEALKTDEFVPSFIFVLNNLYDKNPEKHKWFRWHDSGDLQNIEHLVKINDICLATPNINHWLPTREFKIVGDFLKKYDKADNLLIRMSAVMVGQGLKTDLPYSTVGYDGEEVKDCPAYSQGGMCGDCRACWDENININYPLH